MALSHSHQAHIVRSDVKEVSFGYYSEAEIRSLSAVRVTAAQAFDALSNVLPK